MFDDQSTRCPLVVSEMLASPQADDLPPESTDAEPNHDIDDTGDRAHGPPSRQLYVAGTKENGSGTRPIVSQTTEQITKKNRTNAANKGGVPTATATERNPAYIAPTCAV